MPARKGGCRSEKLFEKPYLAQIKLAENILKPEEKT